jgi:hypothetical protein
VTATPAWGALLGAAAAAGVLLVWTRMPVRRRPTLDARLSPYVGELSAESARRRYLQDARTLTPFPTLERIVRPYLADGADLLERVLGGGTSVRRRLEHSASSLSGSRPTGATPPGWPGCCTSASCPGCTCPPWPRRPPGIWSGPARTPAGI